jgi:Fe2+ or Zn2+ uptake regulation protein
MIDRDTLHQEVRVRLEANRRRLTSNHRLVIDVLADAGRPLTIPQILPRIPGLAQSSLYRTLTVLEEAGTVSRLVVGSNHAHFELSEQIGHHHHHLVCQACGAVTDIDLAPETEAIIDSALAALARRHSFRVAGHQIDAIGHCSDCA